MSEQTIALMKFVYQDPELREQWQVPYLGINEDGTSRIVVHIRDAWITDVERAEEIVRDFNNDPAGCFVRFGVGIIPNSKPIPGHFEVVKYQRID